MRGSAVRVLRAINDVLATTTKAGVVVAVAAWSWTVWGVTVFEVMSTWDS